MARLFIEIFFKKSDFLIKCIFFHDLCDCPFMISFNSVGMHGDSLTGFLA